MVICRICKIELIENQNCYSSYLQNYNYICKNCEKIRQKNLIYQNKNKEYHLKNKEHYSQLFKEWYLIHKNERDKYSKNYKLTDKGKDVIKKSNRTRKLKRRNLGFYSLNEEFKNSEFHHIDKINGIFIPKKLHQSIRHNLWTGKNMEIINFVAYFFLLQQNINQFNGVF